MDDLTLAGEFGQGVAESGGAHGAKLPQLLHRHGPIQSGQRLAHPARRGGRGARRRLGTGSPYREGEGRPFWVNWTAKGSPAGDLRRESADMRAERIVAEELGRLGWSEMQLRERRKRDPAKLAQAAGWRRETTLTVGWIASRLHLGTRQSAAVKLPPAGATESKRWKQNRTKTLV
jgi:hypothetical protein